MGYQAIREYLLKLHDRYRESGKAEKSRFFEEAQFFTGKTRKHLIRVLSGPRESLERKKASGRPPVYGEDLLPHLRALRIAMEQISGDRMKAALPEWLRFYEAENFDLRQRSLLLNMSPATIERFLKKLRGEERVGKGLSATRSPSRSLIAIRPSPSRRSVAALQLFSIG